MREHLVDHDVGNRQVVALLRALRLGEQSEVRAAVGQAALGDAGELPGEGDLIDERAKRVHDAERLTALGQGEGNVVRAGGGVVVRDDLQESREAGREVRSCRERRILQAVSQIVGEMQPAQLHRLHAGIVDLEPITTTERRGHPLVELEQRPVAERRGNVLRALGRDIQHPVGAAVGHATDGPIRRLNAEADRVQQFAAALRTVEEVDGIAGSLEAEAGVERRSRIRGGR